MHSVVTDTAPVCTSDMISPVSYFKGVPTWDCMTYKLQLSQEPVKRHGTVFLSQFVTLSQHTRRFNCDYQTEPVDIYYNNFIVLFPYSRLFNHVRCNALRVDLYCNMRRSSYFCIVLYCTRVVVTSHVMHVLL